MIRIPDHSAPSAPLPIYPLRHAASRPPWLHDRNEADLQTEPDMSIAEMVYEQVKSLPEPLAREVLDFVGFLRERRDRGEWRDLMNAQGTSLAALWNSAEDAVWDNA
jgi:hypothetical protein